jgi:hypothetical protein
MSRQIDALIAEKVFGWKGVMPLGPNQSRMWISEVSIDHPEFNEEYGGKIEFAEVLFKPSTLISDSWLVVEKMREKEFYCNIYSFKDHFSCEFEAWSIADMKDEHKFSHRSNVASLAICKAALKALGVPHE